MAGFEQDLVRAVSNVSALVQAGHVIPTTQPNVTPNTPVDFVALRQAAGGNADTVSLGNIFTSSGTLTENAQHFLQKAGLPVTGATTVQQLASMTVPNSEYHSAGNIIDLAAIAVNVGGNYQQLTREQIQNNTAIPTNETNAGLYLNDFTSLGVSVCMEGPTCSIYSFRDQVVADARVAAEHQLTVAAQGAHERFVQQVGSHINTDTCTASATRANSDDCARLVGTAVSDRNTARNELRNERTNGQQITIPGTNGAPATSRPSLQTAVSHKDDWTLPQVGRAIGEGIVGIGLIGTLVWAYKNRSASGAVFDARLKPYRDNLEDRIAKKLKRLSEAKNDDGDLLYKIDVKKDARHLTNILMEAWRATAAHPADTGVAACLPLDAVIPGTNNKYISDKAVSDDGLKALLSIVSENPAYSYHNVQEHARLILDLVSDDSSQPKEVIRKAALKPRLILPDARHLAKMLTALCSVYEDSATGDANDLIEQLSKTQLNMPKGAGRELTKPQLLEILKQAQKEMGDEFGAPWTDYLEALEKDAKGKGDDAKDDGKKAPPAPEKTPEEKAKDTITNFLNAGYNSIKDDSDVKKYSLDAIVNALLEFAKANGLLSEAPIDIIEGKSNKNYLADGGNDEIKQILRKIQAEKTKATLTSAFGSFGT